MLLSLLVTKSEIVLDSGLDAMDSGFQVPDSGFFDNGTAILDSNRYSLSCTGRNPKQQFPGFRIPDFTSKNFPDSGIRIPLHVETFGKKYG